MIENIRSGAQPVKKWMGSTPTVCDICQKKFEGAFIDAATVSGRWGLLCTSCHKQHGVGLGTGRGQKYNLATLIKVEG